MKEAATEQIRSTLEKWLQILVAVIALIYFAWHVASKDDIKELRAEMSVLRTEMNQGFSELRTDIKQLNQDYKNHLVQHNQEK